MMEAYAGPLTLLAAIALAAIAVTVGYHAGRRSGARTLWRIRHADGIRYRTLDSIGCPDWTTDPEKALTTTLREHVDAYAADDPEDVRIVEVAP